MKVDNTKNKQVVFEKKSCIYKELTEAIPFSKCSTVEVDIRVGLWDEKGK